MPAHTPRKSPGFWGVAQRTAKSSPCRKFFFLMEGKTGSMCCGQDYPCLVCPCPAGWLSWQDTSAVHAWCLPEPFVSPCFSWGAAGSHSYICDWHYVCISPSQPVHKRRGRAQLPTCCQWFAWDKHAKFSRGTRQRWMPYQHLAVWKRKVLFRRILPWQTQMDRLLTFIYFLFLYPLTIIKKQEIIAINLPKPMYKKL